MVMLQYSASGSGGEQAAGTYGLALFGRRQAGLRANHRPCETASATLANIERYAKAPPSRQSHGALRCTLELLCHSALTKSDRRC